LERLSEGYCISIFFHFVIFIELAKTNDGMLDQYLQLLPSLELDEVVIDPTTKKRYVQPNIVYQFRSLVEYAIGGDGKNYVGMIRLPVVIIPIVNAFTLTDTASFPLEFREEVTNRFRRNFGVFNFGKLTVSLREPPPIIYSVSTGKSNIEVRLRFEFVLASAGPAKPFLSELSFTLVRILRTKMFYVVEPFLRMPSQTLFYLSSCVRIYDEICDLGRYSETGVHWDYMIPGTSGMDCKASVLPEPADVSGGGFYLSWHLFSGARVGASPSNWQLRLSYQSI